MKIMSRTAAGISRAWNWLLDLMPRQGVQAAALKARKATA